MVLITNEGGPSVFWDWQTKTSQLIFQQHHSAENVCISSDGSIVATLSTGDSLQLCDAVTGLELRRLPIDPNWHGNSFALSPDNKHLLVQTSASELQLWDYINAEKLYSLKYGWNAGRRICFSADGKRFVTAGLNATIRVCEALNDGNLLQLFRYKMHDDFLGAIGLTPDSKYVVAGVGEQVHLLEISTGDRVRVFDKHIDWIRSLAVTPDGSFLLTAFDDGTVRKWDIHTGAEISCIYIYEDGWRTIYSDGSEKYGGVYRK